MRSRPLWRSRRYAYFLSSSFPQNLADLPLVGHENEMRCRVVWLQQRWPRDRGSRNRRLLLALWGVRRGPVRLVKAFGLGAAWAPTRGWEGNSPETRIGVVKFDPDLRQLLLPRVDVLHVTSQFFARRHVHDAQDLF